MTAPIRPSTLLRQPSGWLPLAMSATALALVVGTLVTGVVTRGEDEGTAARLFQLLLAAQMPIVTWFAASWLPRAPRPALIVLGLQVGAGVVALAPVIILEL